MVAEIILPLPIGEQTFAVYDVRGDCNFAMTIAPTQTFHHYRLQLTDDVYAYCLPSQYLNHYKIARIVGRFDQYDGSHRLLTFDLFELNIGESKVIAKADGHAYAILRLSEVTYRRILRADTQDAPLDYTCVHTTILPGLVFVKTEDEGNNTIQSFGVAVRRVVSPFMRLRSYILTTQNPFVEIPFSAPNTVQYTYGWLAKILYVNAKTEPDVDVLHLELLDERKNVLSVGATNIITYSYVVLPHNVNAEYIRLRIQTYKPLVVFVRLNQLFKLT